MSNVSPIVFLPGNPPKPCAQLMTEEELVQFLRIPELSSARDYRHVIENLKRMHGLPRIHICGKPVYPLWAILEWVEEKMGREKQ